MGRTVTFWINRKSFPSVTMSDFGDEFCEKLETSLRILSNSTGSRCRAKTLQGLKYNLKYKLPEAEKIPSMKEAEMCFRTSMHYGPSYVTLFGDTSKKELQEALRVSEHAIILETRTPIEEPILGKNCDLIKGVLESCFSPLLKSAPCEGDPNGDDVTEFVYDISPSIYDGQVNSQTEENMEAKIKAAVEENSTDKVETATEPKRKTCRGCRSRKCRRSMIPPSVYGVPGFYPLPWPQKICLRGKCC
ncbi:unnamed protein product [Calicophoron daubneyi]|uniref:Uncharacterized protein n=1 Tax=Calicophoron daubneyi TaxID=300641 RepID=A0AAV2TYW7_CALDB